MTYKEIKTLLETTGLPVAYYQWEEGGAPEPPYIVFYFPNSNDFIADDSNYSRIRELNVELYTNRKDFALEEIVEGVLSNLVYSRDETYIDSEGLYLVAYYTEVVITDEQ